MGVRCGVEPRLCGIGLPVRAVSHYPHAPRVTGSACAGGLPGQAPGNELNRGIGFRRGAAGRNEPYLVGTRLKVRQVMETVRGHDADIDQTASSLGIASATVRAAVAYYAEFTEEVDADADWSAEVEADERHRWEREQAAIA